MQFFASRKTLTFHVKVHIQSVWNKNKNNCCCSIFLEKCSYQLPENNNRLQMLYYDRINSSEGIAINEKNASIEWDICHYWYFLDKGFKFQPDVCNGCHGLLMMPMNLSDIATLNIKGADYCCISGISKREYVNLLQ